MCVRANKNLGAIPYPICTQALDILVSKLFDDKLKKPIVILEGEYHTKLNPFIRRGKFVYSTVFCKKPYYLGSYRINNITDPIMSVDINIIDGRTIWFKSSLDKKVDRIVVNNHTYYISQGDLTEHFKIIDPKARKALMVHTEPEKNSYRTFG